MTFVRPRLLALATAVPAHRLGQEDAARRARLIFGKGADFDLDRLLPVFDHAGVGERRSCVAIDWFERPHGWVERNALYLEHAVKLLERAALAALHRARLHPHDIDEVVCVSTTGIATPSLDAMVMGRIGLRPDVRRLPVFGLGCGGGVAGLARAADLARARPQARILCLVVELCSLTFRESDATKSNLVAAALFGDGAAAAIVSCRGDGPALGAAAEHTWPNSLDVMGWEVAKDGLKAIFSRDIPTLVERQMRAVTERVLAADRMKLRDIRHFVCHPGGAKVVSALEAAFELPQGALDDARAVLRQYGNMSAATVLFVLERMLGSGAEGPMLMTALGPGFTAGFLRLDAPG
ncbi:MAG TPA: 3-oxoacyl-[acyl-carrier-protein] synthase III C-terminal domain-containing protein [Stellaceae bacterium]|nr:3-oxoacyl-[acyl-carrier-protein] synthase III C-terminal domain-containing protein [Stellaceae bacterium]